VEDEDTTETQVSASASKSKAPKKSIAVEEVSADGESTDDAASSAEEETFTVSRILGMKKMVRLRGEGCACVVYSHAGTEDDVPCSVGGLSRI